MEKQIKVTCFNFTFPCGMKVMLREPKISDTRLASQVAGRKAGNNQAHLSVLIQEEMTKLLIIEVDGVKLKAIQKESLDDLFSIKQYGNVLKAIEMIAGDDEEGEIRMGIAISGA